MTDRASLEARWTQHWKDATPSFRVARASFRGDFGAEALGPDPVKRPTRAVATSTMAKALRQEATKIGHPLSDNLLRMMLGQKLGCEGAMPGLSGTTFAGTNNSGAAQVPGGAAGKAWGAAKALSRGWIAFAHKDSNPPGPSGGPYIGWYYGAPTVSDSAHQWLTGYGGVKSVLAHEPATPEEYAAQMYHAGYFTGLSHDADKEIASYASCVRRGMPSLATLNGPANDPTAFSLDPSQFRSLADRKITENLFDLAKSGKQGSAWAFLLPSTWEEMVAQNGVVSFGEPVTKLLAGAHHAEAGILGAVAEHPVLSALGALALAVGLGKLVGGHAK